MRELTAGMPPEQERPAAGRGSGGADADLHLLADLADFIVCLLIDCLYLVMAILFV